MDQDKERIFREILESYLKNVNTGKLIKGENVKSLEEKKELIRNIIRSLKIHQKHIIHKMRSEISAII